MMNKSDNLLINQIKVGREREEVNLQEKNQSLSFCDTNKYFKMKLPAIVSG